MLRTVLLVAIIGSGGKGGASHWVKRKKLEPRNLDPHDPRPHGWQQSRAVAGEITHETEPDWTVCDRRDENNSDEETSSMAYPMGFAVLIGEANEAKHYGF